MVTPNVTGETQDLPRLLHFGERVEGVRHDEGRDRPRRKCRHHVCWWHDDELDGPIGTRGIAGDDRRESIRAQELLQDDIVDAPPEGNRHRLAREIRNRIDSFRSGQS
jgi:hypothetical protein